MILHIKGMYQNGHCFVVRCLALYHCSKLSRGGFIYSDLSQYLSLGGNNMQKRLFFFASYDPDRVVDDSLLWYLQALSKLGDIVFIMDNDISRNFVQKVKNIPNVLYADALRHQEYDFGSYKRGFLWAQESNILKRYDWIYLVNDSVFGPFFDLEPILDNMEKQNAENAFGMIGLKAEDIAELGWPDHVQSWFVGLSQRVFSAYLEDKWEDISRNSGTSMSIPLVVFHFL